MFFYNTTIIIRVVSNAWSRQDIRLGQAARVLGASPWRAFREVTLPLLWPSILAGTLLVFLFNFTSFGVVLMLGGPQFATLEVEIYIQALHLLNLPLASILSILQLVCTLGITVIHNRLSTRGEFAQAHRSQTIPTRRPKRGFERWVVFLLVVILFTLLVSPLAALAFRSVVKLDADRGERGDIQQGFTLQYYRELWVNRTGSLFYVAPIEAAKNSLVFALITIALTMVLGLLVAYGLRQKTALNQVLDPLMMLPLGASAITLGLGFILVLQSPAFQ